MNVSMQYKALLVDVDGTLMDQTEKKVSPAVTRTLAGLQARGVPVIVATGRSAYAARPVVLGGLQADYLVCTNGAYIADAAGRVLWDQPMRPDQFETICDLGRAGHCIGFSFADGYYCYYDAARFVAFFRTLHDDMQALRATDDFTRHLRGLPYAGFGLVAPAAARHFNATQETMRMTAYEEGAYDINQIDCNKATATERLLDLLGLRWSETVFIGDGENDVELLRAAGLGVAMGNAPPHVKVHADLITGTVADDGVARVVHEVF